MRNPIRLYECRDYYGNVDGKGQRPLEVVGGTKTQSWGSTVGGAGAPT